MTTAIESVSATLITGKERLKEYRGCRDGIIIEAIPYQTFKEKIATTKELKGTVYIEKELIIVEQYIKEESHESMRNMRK